MLKKIGRGIAILFLLLAILVFAIIAPINYKDNSSPVEDISSIKLEKVEGDSVLQIGWAAVNITPGSPIDMAGYGPRGPYQNVLDSLYSRTIVIDNGKKKVALISLDLILFPREVKYRIEEELSLKGFTKNEIYLTATHTHNGFGNWEKSIGGQFAFGNFSEKNVAVLVKKILDSIEKAMSNKSPASVGFQKIDVNELVSNRLAPEVGTIDPYLRVVHLLKENGQRGMLISFSGHATNLNADVWELSRDYPGILVDNLEELPAIEFAMFAAGMVGSHNIAIDIAKGKERIIKTGEKLADKIISHMENVFYDSISTIGGIDIDVELPPSQLRITKHAHIRDWVFRSLLGPLKANIKVLQVGNLMLVGMPCDYSGELSVNNNLDQLADRHGKKLFITSFNGNYVGYITEDSHYNTCNHDEVRTLNWVGPNKGKYFTDIITRIIEMSD